VHEILVLGPVRVVADDGQEMAPRSDLQRTLLAVLAAHRDRVVSVDELIDAMWGDRLPERPVPTLHSQVFRLRRLLGDADCISTEGAGYRLRVPSDRVDSARFENLAAAARRHGDDRERAIDLYDAALALWRGRAFADADAADAVRGEAIRLEELRTRAGEERAVLLLEGGRSADAADAAEALMRDEPFREAPVAIRMRALAAAGRHAEAVRTFAGFRRTLGEELGLEPSPELITVEAEILRHERARPAVGLPGNSFVGRELDLVDVISALSSGRLVTLTGPGGIGKTRLALHAAARLGDGYPGGTCLVELAAVETDEAVAAAAASALGIHNAFDVDRIVEFLATRTALLIVDNCEHVLDGTRALVSAALSRTPGVAVLATSRSRLGVDGEYVLPVGPLPVPEWDDPDAPAVALFADRAAAVRPGFVLSDQNIGTVAQLCRRLDGIPLAIELAAARTVARTAEEVLADVTDHTARLADRHRSTVRHRSLAAVIDWSYSLLDPAEQDLFTHVAVFSGGFTTEAAAAVTAGAAADEVADGVRELVEHSLVNASDVDGATRFAMLEPIREQAERRLAATGALATVRRRHADWFVRWVAIADEGLRSTDETRFARCIRQDLANLRVAHAWALDHDVTMAAAIVAHLYWYAFWYGATDVSDWALAVIARDPAPGTATAGAYATAALGTWRRGDLDGGQALAQRGIELAADEPNGARFAWEALSSAAMVRGDYHRALTCQSRALDLALHAGDLTHAAREHGARALTLGYLDRGDEAQTELREAAALAARGGTPSIEAFCDYVAGELLLETRAADALPRLSRSRDIARTLGNRYLAAIAGASAVSCASRLGRPRDAVGDYGELLDYFDRTGSVAQQWTVVRSLIETLASLGEDDAAAVLLGALDTTTTGAPLIGADAERIRRVRVALGRRLGKHRFEQAAKRGAALGDRDALALARHHATLRAATVAGHDAAGSQR
jgi:predicted ATPase/DNA-binding SARP family transcriptional activator